MPASLVELLITLLLIMINGVFSLSETAFVSARKARLQQRAESGDARAQAALADIETENEKSSAPSHSCYLRQPGVQFEQHLFNRSV